MQYELTLAGESYLSSLPSKIGSGELVGGRLPRSAVRYSKRQHVLNRVRHGLLPVSGSFPYLEGQFRARAERGLNTDFKWLLSRGFIREVS